MIHRGEDKMTQDRMIAVRNSKTVYRDGNLKLKVFNDDYSKADIFNEALNQARIEETGLNVPKVIEVAKHDGKWTFVTDYISGTTISKMMQDHPENMDGYLEMFTSLQVEVHSKTCPGLVMLKDKLKRYIRKSDLSATDRFDLYDRLMAMPAHFKLCHGDFHPSNVVITEDGTPFIIDWSHAAQGNASADAVRTYLSLRMNWGLAVGEMYIKKYCEKSNTDIDYVQKWTPIIAAAETVRGNEEQREFLKQKIDVRDHAE